MLLHHRIGCHPPSSGPEPVSDIVPRSRRTYGHGLDDLSHSLMHRVRRPNQRIGIRIAQVDDILGGSTKWFNTANHVVEKMPPFVRERPGAARLRQVDHLLTRLVVGGSVTFAAGTKRQRQPAIQRHVARRHAQCVSHVREGLRTTVNVDLAVVIPDAMSEIVVVLTDF